MMWTKCLILLILVHFPLSIADQNKQNLSNIYINKIGNLRFTKQFWRIQYNLNIHEYLSTADLLENYINKLNIACIEMNSPLCDFFIIESQKFKNQVKSDIRAFQLFKRSKRELVLIVLFGVTIISLIATIVNTVAFISITNELGENVENMRNVLNATQESFDLQQKMLIQAEEKINQIGNKLSKHMISMNSFKKQSSILFIMLYLIRKHDNMHKRLGDFFMGNHRQKMFSVIDFNRFLDTIEEINTNLTYVGDDLSLPKFNNQNMTDLIKISYINDGSDLSIILDIPILSGKQYTLHEIIPLPTKDESDNELSILDINSLYYLQNEDETFLIDEKTLIDKCKHTPDLTVCDMSIYPSLEPPTGCMRGLLYNNSVSECDRKPINNENYLILITDKILYVYVVHPTKIKMLCNGM